MTVSMSEDDRDKIVAEAIRRGECPFGRLRPGQSIAHCPLGFPGCGCGDELMLNPHLIVRIEPDAPEPEP